MWSLPAAAAWRSPSFTNFWGVWAVQASTVKCCLCLEGPIYGCYANWTSAALQVCRRLEAFTYNNWSMSWPQNHKFSQNLIFSLTQTSLGSIVPCCHSFDPSKSSRVPWHPGHRAASAHPDSRHVHCLVKEHIRLSLGEPATEKSMCRDMCPLCLYLHYSSLRIHGGAMIIGPDRQWRFLMRSAKVAIGLKSKRGKSSYFR